MTISDQNIRKLALDTTQSFIVQAPAGSGKTTLLVQRILALLTKVNDPEEIVAITFTKKAANEMRERVIEALKNSQDQNRVLQDKLQNWNLLENPQRLRIQTIDSLCNYIAKQHGINILDSADRIQYYRKAINTILQNYQNPNLDKILLHLDNNYNKVENLLVEMLQTREQWLPYVIGNEREHLNQGLQNIINETLEKTSREFLSLPTEINQEITELANFSWHNLSLQKTNFQNDKNIKSDNLPFININKSHKNKSSAQNYHNVLNPDAKNINSLEKFRVIANILLTKDNNWRKDINIKEGFPSKDASKNIEEKNLFVSMKQRMKNLLEKLSLENQNFAALKQNLSEIKILPPEKYSDQQWEIIAALLAILPLLAAELKVVFEENNCADFAEISIIADQILGDSENITDYALNLEYQIKHLLVDEFQDTSLMQYRLLQKITANWETNDGKTLFLVGDPMQSIYRFRQAEVGLFLYTKQYGLGNLQLKSLTLSENFRSNKKIVEWVNFCFAKILPKIPAIDFGAVPFSQANSSKIDSVSKVTIKIFARENYDDGENEAQNVLQLINKLPSTETIAIIVRNRSHLTKIYKLLKLNKINFQAIEIEPLEENQTIIDLFSLTKALQNLSDRISWLAILRTPWCKIPLHDLRIIATTNSIEQPIWETILQYENLPIENTSKQNLARIVPIINYNLDLIGKLNLRNIVEATWMALGGPACLNDTKELDNVNTFFRLLENFWTNSKGFINLSLFSKKLADFYASNSDENSNVKIMTIHGAKGLEFDHVIIPGLGRKPNHSLDKIMLWMERTQITGKSNLILAPIKHHYDNEDMIYQYLKAAEHQKEFFETGRLLYVAATRAKKSLNLFGSVIFNKEPIAGSLLHQLWPVIAEKDIVKESVCEISIIDSLQSISTNQKLSADWEHPIAIKFAKPEKLENALNNENIFNYTNPTITLVGTLAHKCLQQLANYLEEFKIELTNLADNEITNFLKDYLQNKKSYWQNLLLQAGCIDNAIHLQTIIKTISNILQNEKGKWILSLQHQNIYNEYAITTVINDEIKHFVIDRTFIDKFNRLWIIDYKITQPKNLQIEKSQYQAQLEQYAIALKQKNDFNNSKVNLGLYFPLTSEWIEWET